MERCIELVRHCFSRLTHGWIIAGLIALIFAPTMAVAQTATATVAAGPTPQTATVNPVTNKTYVANLGTNNVTVINGATNTTVTVMTGNGPQAVAVNPVTNKAYVANLTSGSVTVIDGATDTVTTTVTVGTQPFALAVNPVTNKIYVANNGSANVTVIDGATNTATATVTAGAGAQPYSVAVNPVTNMIYVANKVTNNVTVINGVTNAPANVAVGTDPRALAVNPVTNKIYVANTGSANVTMIDGATNTATATVAAGTSPVVVAVNPVTNKIYVTNSVTNNVTVIDGVTNTATATVATGTGPVAVSVNPATNQIYVANNGSPNVTVINGVTNTTTTVAAGTNPRAVGVNPVTNKIYVANQGSANVTVIDGAANTAATIIASPGGFVKPIFINPVTNRIYVGNAQGNTLDVIDGATGTMVTAIPGSGPRGMGINIVTNRIYAANEGNNTIQVINGADNSVITTVPVGAGIGIDRGSVAVNPLTNKIYVVSQTTSTISVIDGVTNIATTVPVGSQPYYIAVNPATNKVYVSNRSSGNVMVINGTTNAITATITGIGAFPDTIAINPKTNKIYVNQSEIDGVTNAVMPVAGVVGRLVGVNPNNNKVFYYNPSVPGSGSVSVFDATSKTASTLAGLNNIRGVSLDTVSNKLYLADGPLHIYDATLNALTSVAVGAFTVTVNPITGKAYATPDTNTIDVTDFSVVTAANEQDIPLAAAITTLPGNTTQTGRPLFGFGAATTFAPTAPALGKLYYQVDSRMGTWTEAPASGPGYAATLAPLLPGEHTIFAYATDGQDATSVNSGFQSGPLTSKVVAYTFVVTAEGQLAVTSVNGGSSTTFGAPFNVVVEAHDGAPTQNVTRDTVVQLSVATGTGTLGGTTSCTILTGNSFCTVTGVTYSKAETGVVLRASTTSGMVLTSANSTAFDQAKGNQTITFNALGNKTFGDAAFAVSATGGASGNAVTFSSTTTGKCTVAGSTVTIIAGGTCTVRASQAGNTNYNAATDVDQSFTVNPANQTITFGALSNHVFGSADFTVGAGASSGLAVTFSSTATGVCTVTGNTVSIVAGGTCTVRASQAGNTNYNAAPDVDRSFTVTQASQSITSGSLGSKTFGDAPFTVSGSATSGLPVTFTSTDTAVCTVSGNTVTIVAVGSCAIQVSQAGNGNYSAAISVTSSFTVNQASQVITFGALGNKTFGDAAFDVSATGGASGNTITFSSQTSGVCTVAGSTVTIVSAGTCTVRASQAGNANYAAASNVDQSFTVNQISQAITFGALGNKTFGDAAFDVSATGGASGNPVTFSSTTASICSVSGSTVTLAAVGSCNIHASQAGNGNYAAATDVDQNFNVAAAPVTNKNVVISASPNPPVAGQPVVFIITVTGTNPTGTVTIKDGTTVIGTVDVSKGTGRFTTANLPAGSHSLTGSYAGDANNPAGGSDPEVVVVPAGGTLNPVSAGSSPNQPKDNETVTFTATVAGNNPTGEIIFLDGATEIGRVPVVNGKASFTAPKFKSGKHPILMRYSGDSNNATADSPIATIDVQSSDSGGGGGCAIDLNATFDPTLLLMALAAMGYTVRRRQQGK